ncbi:MAG TPA: hypothetical protein VFH56_03030 [Acidimicrobiales bacterium]|nr:hypothetical protein [Acidimicrobiales bacterium]
MAKAVERQTVEPRSSSGRPEDPFPETSAEHPTSRAQEDQRLGFGGAAAPRQVFGDGFEHERWDCQGAQPRAALCLRHDAEVPGQFLHRLRHRQGPAHEVHVPDP